MAMQGYVWLRMAMYGYVGLWRLLLVTNGEPLYDAYTRYLPFSQIDRLPPVFGLAFGRTAYLLWRAARIWTLLHETLN